MAKNNAKQQFYYVVYRSIT